MHHRHGRRVINLQKRKGRARHFQSAVLCQDAQQGAGKCGFSGAQSAIQRHHIAFAQQGRHKARDLMRGLEIAQGAGQGERGQNFGPDIKHG